MSNIVAIVGRPNVGKSTFFNRLIQRREAIVDAVSGVTRDRNYGKCDWNGREFSVIDTGGYITGSEDIFENEIRRQVELAIDESNVIVFVVDVTTGITGMDEDVARVLRKTDKPVLLMVNKVDSAKRVTDASEFYALGLGEYFMVSSISGSGTGELLDAVVGIFKQRDTADEDPMLPRFTVVGRPNAGKSSFINALIGEDRNIVTEISGTTRDSLDTKYNKFGHKFVLVDTAGLRKKSKVSENLEFYSVMRAIRAIEYSDVCVLIVDATRGFEVQDLNIFNLIEKNKKGVVILVNKWDLVEKDTHTTKQFQEKIRHGIAPFSQVPIIFVSAITKQRIYKAVEMAIQVYKNRSKKVPTHKLNQVLLPFIERTPPPAIKGKYIKIKFCTQLPTQTPQFAFFANLPQYVKEPYKRFLENKIRDNFNFEGVPIQVYIRKK